MINWMSTVWGKSYFAFSCTVCGYLFGKFLRKNYFYRLSEIANSIGSERDKESFHRNTVTRVKSM
jgi:hypothetical protein